MIVQGLRVYPPRVGIIENPLEMLITILHWISHYQ